MDSRCDVERRTTGCPVVEKWLDEDRDRRRSSDNDLHLHTFERIVVVFVQLKNYLGTYWLAPWFFVYIYPSILAYESYGFVGSFFYCNIIQILFFIVFEFWDESFNWTPLHDIIRTYSSHIFGSQSITKNVDELILFCIWVLSWAAVPITCFINGQFIEIPSERFERLNTYITVMTTSFITSYILILLWIDMYLSEVKSNIHVENQNANKNILLSKSEFIEDSFEPEDIPDLETLYEDISITSEFKIDNILPEFSEVISENIIASDELCNYMKVKQDEEAKEQDMDVISLSSSTISDFDVITEDEINLLK